MSASRWYVARSIPGVTNSPEGVILWNFPGERFGTAQPQVFYAYGQDGSYYAERSSASKEARKTAGSVVSNKPIGSSPLFLSLQKWLKSAISDGMLDTAYSIRQPEPNPRKVTSKPALAPEVLKVTHPDAAVSRALNGPYTILQFHEPWTKKSAYTIEQIVSIINDALGTTFRLWDGWAPTALWIRPMQSDRVMGRASPLRDGFKSLELNRTLFTEYSADSIRRTILHELAHHKRFDEGELGPGDGHDERFCELLAMVDEVVRAEPRTRCRYFTDDIDHSMLASRAKGAGQQDIVVVYEQIFSVDSRGRRRGNGRMSLKVKPKRGRAFSPVVYPSTEDGIRSIVSSYGGDAHSIEGSSTINGNPLANVRTLADVVFEIVYFTKATSREARPLKALADELSAGGKFDAELYSFYRGAYNQQNRLDDVIKKHGSIVGIEYVDDEEYVEPNTYVVDYSYGWPFIRIVFSDGVKTGWISASSHSIYALLAVLGSDVSRIRVSYPRWARSPGKPMATRSMIVVREPGTAVEMFNFVLDDGEIQLLSPPSVVNKVRAMLGSIPSGGISWLSSRLGRT